MLKYFVIILFFCLSAVCDNPTCTNGICSAPNNCDCTGTGYMGNQCDVGEYIKIKLELFSLVVR